MAFHGSLFSLYMGKACNNHCIFCVVSNRQDTILKTEDVIQKLDKAIRLGMLNVVFSGGECTIRPDIIQLVKTAKQMGFLGIQLQTNGRMLANEKFTDSIIEAGATEFAISFHGHIPEIHDTITGVVGSFDESIKGIRNIQSTLNHHGTIITNTVITNLNLQYLDKIPGVMASLGVVAMQFAYLHAQGKAKKVFKTIAPRKSEASPYIKKALVKGLENGYGIGTIMVEAFPYCFLRDYEAFCSDIFIPPTFVRGRDGNDIESFTLDKARVKGNSCCSCTFCNICYGPWIEYPEYYGWNEFEPILDIQPCDVIPKNFLSSFSRRGNI